MHLINVRLVKFAFRFNINLSCNVQFMKVLITEYEIFFSTFTDEKHNQEKTVCIYKNKRLLNYNSKNQYTSLFHIYIYIGTRGIYKMLC